mgnify:CR=1 FL=1
MSNSSFRRTKPSSNNTNLTNQTTSSHTRTNSSPIHFHFEQTSCNRTSNCRSQSWSNPNLRIFNNIWHLKHTSSKPLRKNATPTVFLKTQHRKTHHLSTTPSNSSTTSKTNKPKSRTNSSRTNWQSQSNTNNKIPIQNGCNLVDQTIKLPTELAAAPIYFAVKTVSKAPTKIVTAGVTYEITHANVVVTPVAGQGKTYGYADDSNKQNSQRPTSTTSNICSTTNSRQRKQHQSRHIHCKANSNSHSRPNNMSISSKVPSITQKLKNWIFPKMQKLLSQCFNNSSNQERRKKPLCHTTHSINQIAFNIFVHSIFCEIRLTLLLRKINCNFEKDGIRNAPWRHW